MATDDPAIKCWQSGDAAAAVRLWQVQDRDPRLQFIASHNLAIYDHVTALDQSLLNLARGGTKEEEDAITCKWHDAFDRWEVLATDPKIWDWVRQRVVSLGDPRLTSGFARRMEAVFPLAMDKINAELALEYGQEGQAALE